MARRAARARSAPAETRRRGGAGRSGRDHRCAAAAPAAPWCRPHTAEEHAERRCQEPPPRGRLGRRGCDHRWQDESKRSQRKLRRSAGEGRIQRKRFLCKKTLRRPTKRKKNSFMNVRPCQVLLRDAPRCRGQHGHLHRRRGGARRAAQPAEGRPRGLPQGAGGGLPPRGRREAEGAVGVRLRPLSLSRLCTLQRSAAQRTRGPRGTMKFRRVGCHLGRSPGTARRAAVSHKVRLTVLG